MRIIRAFLVVTDAAGDVLEIFMFTYAGVICLFRHCLLKYILAQHFCILDLVFLYLLTMWA
jgi:hypothetical protein